MGYFRILRKTFSASQGGELLFSKKEVYEFFRLGLPMILVFFSGWLIFEFQMMAITDIQGISKDALAAGAVWVQVESSLAAAQDGWIRSTSMRMLNLLGKQDRGASKAFMVLNTLSLAVVVLSNVPFMLLQKSVAQLLSNDAEVQRWLYKLLWVLVPHTVTRILSINFSVFYVPLGRGLFGSLQTFVSFYCIAAPIACIVALTNVVTTAELPKMVACVGLTTIAQFASACISGVWLWRLDWIEAGRIIKDRANMDRESDPALERYEGA
jgi:Na+-driven multidrug efflux pump